MIFIFEMVCFSARIETMDTNIHQQIKGSFGYSWKLCFFSIVVKMLNFANIPPFWGHFVKILEKSFPPNFLHRTVFVNLKMDFSEHFAKWKGQNFHLALPCLWVIWWVKVEPTTKSLPMMNDEEWFVSLAWTNYREEL